MRHPTIGHDVILIATAFATRHGLHSFPQDAMNTAIGIDGRRYQEMRLPSSPEVATSHPLQASDLRKWWSNYTARQYLDQRPERILSMER